MADHARRPCGSAIHRLLEIAFQHVCDLARDRVGTAAGGPRYDQRDRPLRESARASGAEQACGRKRGAKFLAKRLTWRNIRKSSRFIFMRRVRHRDVRYALSAIRAAER